MSGYHGWLLYCLLWAHHAGSNFFWYLKDPAVNFSEYYSYMDCIPEDEMWTPETFKRRPRPLQLGTATTALLPGTQRSCCPHDRTGTHAPASAKPFGRIPARRSSAPTPLMPQSLPSNHDGSYPREL
jgi:hypothetical protein